MSDYMRKVVHYESVEVEPKDLVSVSEAAKLLGMSLPGVIRAAERGVLTEIIDPSREGKTQNRRFFLRSEVEELARSK